MSTADLTEVNAQLNEPIICDAATAKKDLPFGLKRLQDLPTEHPRFLIPGWLPRGTVTMMCAPGGSGKTTMACHIAACQSAGLPSIFDRAVGIPSDWTDAPSKVIYFSSEDDARAVLKPRLECNGANLSNIYTIELEDLNSFAAVKLNSDRLEAIIQEVRPSLVVFDPLQSFIPPDINMGARNAMRQCLNPLLGLGQKYGSTFLILMHANKQSGAWGRNKLADSSDIWDIARSVSIIGDADRSVGLRYISLEKSNYGTVPDSILFKIENGTPAFMGLTPKHDADFVHQQLRADRAAPAKEAAADVILRLLREHNGVMTDKDLGALVMSEGLSATAYRKGKEGLKSEGLITIRGEGYRDSRVFKVFIRDPS